ncbi:MAG TPA: DUF1259 domain-containing protein [Thermoanaerobaculia bacterium]|nr:DUF1259 domain-containing protein [Thermoanaerobaculia bacterium]
MKRSVLLFSLTFLGSLSLMVAAPPPESGWDSVDKVFGSPGKDLPGDVRRYGWPRADLHVTIGGVPVEPGLALGAWAAFKKTGTGDEAMTMGDLVLLESEVEPVLGELEAGGFDILAIHNHLLGETPHVIYIHFHGHGDPAALAKTLKAALAKTKTPAPGKAPAKPTAAQEKTFETLQQALGHKGTMSGTVLQVGVARAEPIQDGGMEVPPSMGMNNPMNFQTVGTQVATTGDFVLIADEVNPVLRELHAHGIQVTALHSHMLKETPRLFFMHFWGVGAPEKIGEGLKAALSKVSTK